MRCAQTLAWPNLRVMVIMMVMVTVVMEEEEQEEEELNPTATYLAASCKAESPSLSCTLGSSLYLPKRSP